MITVAKPRAADYWLVEVRENADLDKGIAGYVRRFTFEGPDCALAAWACWASATKSGFSATAEHIVRTGQRA